MNWIDKLERKIGKYAVRNLMFYIIILYIAGFVLQWINPNFYYAYLDLNMAAIIHGKQVWRLVTFLLQPPSSSPVFMIFALLLYYSIGKQLELVWGAFKFNLYFFMGVIFHILAALIAYLFFDTIMLMGTAYLNLSLFFAFAVMFPETQFYLFMIVPIKVKWLAWVDGAFFLVSIISALTPDFVVSFMRMFLPEFIVGFFTGGSKAAAVAAIVSLLNFLIFFLSSRRMKRFSPRDVKRKQAYKRQVHEARQSQRSSNGAIHRCAVCGRTELDDPNLEFRYCSKCNGNYEYCQDHLFTHEHVK